MDESFSARGAAPQAGEIFASLQTLLANDALRLSERNRRFLSFVVTQTIEGRSDRIKAYAIGVDVFGRDDSFDPTVDPIVRIEATRLRAALTAYYESAGAGDRIRIAMPRGGYVPSFAWSPEIEERMGAVEPAAAGQAGTTPSATVVIHDHSSSADPESELRGELFIDALLVLLRRARFKTLVVPPAAHSAAYVAIRDLFAHPGETYSLDVAVRPMAERRRFSWRFSDLRSGEVLASNFRDFVAKPTPCFDLIDEFADGAAEAIVTVLSAR